MRGDFCRSLVWLALPFPSPLVPQVAAGLVAMDVIVSKSECREWWAVPTLRVNALLWPTP